MQKIIADGLHVIRNHIERDLACVLAGKASERLANIAQTRRAVDRWVDRGLMAWLERQPARSARWLGIHMTPEIVFIGAGSEHTVIRRRGTVRKIHRASIDLDQAGRLALAARHRHLHDILRSYLGEVVVPQQTEVAAHPFRPRREAVVTDQTWVATFRPLTCFPAHLPIIQVTNLRRDVQTFPFLADALHHMAERGLSLYEETGLLLDTSGTDNVVVVDTPTGCELRCLDGLPIASGKAEDVDRIRGQLRHLWELTVHA